MKQATSTGTGKYELLLERCKSLEPVPTAVAHPCEASALAGAVDAGQKGLIVPILVGRPGRATRGSGDPLDGLESSRPGQPRGSEAVALVPKAAPKYS
jgi:hypothetical protein